MGGENGVYRENDFGADFELRVVTHAVLDPDFFTKFQGVLDETAFHDERCRFIFGLVRDYWEEYREHPDVGVLKDILRQSSFRDIGGAVNLLDEMDGLPAGDKYVQERVVKWARWKRIDDILTDEHGRADPTEFADRISEASRIGGDDNEHVKFSADSVELDKNTERKVVPLPWETVNTTLDGGPERGDLGIVITVINGGKTTILVNMARHAMALGLSVVFFTFEDGQQKIRRRLIQTVTGMTKEQITAHPMEATRLAKRFLGVTGGMCDVKQLQSRRSGVMDAMSFCQKVAKVNKRPVDLVITDYADRFRATTKYSEPRHGLREILEDCKYLATNLGVVHWTASQAAKIAVGKDIVGMEHGAEAYGKFESADLAFGFGQTLEDERVNRMTLFTSKMRDAKRHQAIALQTDFSRQRIAEVGDRIMKMKWQPYVKA